MLGIRITQQAALEEVVPPFCVLLPEGVKESLGMSVKQFDRLSLRNQYRLLEKQGQYLTSKPMGLFQVSLYRLFGFFVEVYIHPTAPQSFTLAYFREPGHLEVYRHELGRRFFS